MSWNTDNFREYAASTANPRDADYADPAYYRQDTLQEPHFAQPVQPLDPYAGSVSVPYEPVQMQAYQGPGSLEGYTVDVGAEQRDAATRGSAEGKKKGRGAAGIGGGLVAALAALLKLQWLAFLLKFGWAGITAVISIGFYALIFGWQFAIGLVALLFIHEMGHALVMKLKGIPVGGMIFIPMLGAAVFMRQMPKNARDEAEVGIAGPIAGALASSACLFLASIYPHQVWAALAYFGFFMNLFNLVPIVPFDGGRVLAAIDRRVWILGFLALVAINIWSLLNNTFSVFLLLFLIMAGSQLWARRKVADTPESQAYYSVPAMTRVTLALLYFGLIAVLMIGMSISHGMILPVNAGG
ncbi:MAG: site-2 protease family protein [Ktedonobacteraceae bacterium]|nr:site-2 protease family protein [Ktedonobacteraceae bacterium]